MAVRANNWNRGGLQTLVELWADESIQSIMDSKQKKHQGHARDQQRTTPGEFRRTRPPLADLKFIRSNFFCVNTTRLYRIGISDTLPDIGA